MYTRQLRGRRPGASIGTDHTRNYQRCSNGICILVQPTVTGYAYAVSSCISPRHTRFHLRRDRGGTCTARPLPRYAHQRQFRQVADAASSTQQQIMPSPSAAPAPNRTSR
jgi:hypothetical protein